MKRLKRVSPSVLLTGLVAVTLAVGYMDYRAGTDTTFSAIYLFPIAAAAWFLNRPAAYALATLSSVLWVTGDIRAGAHYASVFIPSWNILARFAIFVFGANTVAALREVHEKLERRAADRAVKLTEEIARRERLQRELLQISEREQQRVGHDIHDSLCQHLTGTALAAEVLVESLPSHSEQQAVAERVVGLLEDGIGLARNLARTLSAAEVSNNGLTGALADFAAATSDLFNVSCRFECPDPLPIDDLDTAVHLYRIAQEAVGNAIKHGEAKDVIIRLDTSDTACVLRVIDNGSGLRTPQPVHGKGMGLRIMSYRSQLIGGRLELKRLSPRGTEVSCALPFPEAAE